MFLTGKTVRTILWYLLLCGVALWASRAGLLGHLANARLTVIRELTLDQEQGEAQVAFFGSSRTWRGIKPDSFATMTEEYLGAPMSAVNLGMGGASRHMSYLIVREYLETHSPEVVFVEVGAVDVMKAPHEMLSRLLSPSDAIELMAHRPYAWEQRGERQDGPAVDGVLAFFDEFDRLRFHGEIALDAVSRGPEDVARALFNQYANGVAGALDASAESYSPGHLLDGWRSRFGDLYWSPAGDQNLVVWDLAERGWGRATDKAGAQARRAALHAVAAENEGKKLQPYRVTLGGRSGNPMVERYSELLAELCREKGVRLIWMELPGFYDGTLSPFQIQFYRRSAELFRPKHAVLHDAELYFDEAHLNPIGARVFVGMLARYLRDHPPR